LLPYLRLASTVLIGLLAGSGLGVTLLEAYLDGSPAFYTEYKQLIIDAYTVQLPLLAVGGILASLGVLYLSRRDRLTVWLTSAAILSLIVGLVITLGVHFPINDEIRDWSPLNVPADWEEVRRRWRTANLVRSVAAMVGFVLLVIPLVWGRRTQPDGWR
jgi:Domain of unknown function (DUF1772)